MKEIVSGIYHWQAEHPEIKKKVSSYFLKEDGIAIDPLLPPEGIEWFKQNKPHEIILTNRYHTRHSAKLREAFGCRIWVNRTGMELGIDLENPSPYSFDDELPGDIQAIKVDAICPDDTALFIPLAGGAIAFADGLMTDDQGLLAFVDDALMADSPEEVEKVKHGLTEALRQIVADYRFDHLLFAHGLPTVGDGRTALRRFLEERGGG